MKINQMLKSPGWMYLLGMLIFAGVSNILFGGVKGMLEYKKSYEIDLSIDLNNLHFFTKDYVKRLVQQLTVSQLPAETELVSFHIFTNEKSLDSLESNLPSSGKTQFREGHLRVDPEGLTSPVEYRFRGGLPLHWLYEKKSFRVKLPAFTTYLGERQFNLVNPSTIYTIPDWISYDMAKAVGLLTPDFFPARLFINDETNGVHFFLSRIDESFLRKNRRMPGSIYSGDTVYTPSPFAAANATEMRERVFPGKEDNISLMWKDHRLWKKNTSRNAQMKQDRGDIKKFIEIINDPNPVKFMHNYEVYFDKKKFNLFWGIDSLLGAYHHDLYHNHKIYFDPYKGKVEPIEWDVRYWSMNIPVPDYPLLKQVRLNPVLDFEKNQVLYELWEKFSVDDMMQSITEKSNVLIPELMADPYRQQPDKYIQLFSKSKVVPFSMSEFDDAIEVLKLTYQARHKAVKDILENSVASFNLEATGSKQVELTIAVSGESPVDVNPWALIPKHLQSQVEIQPVYQGRKLTPLKMNPQQRLFPGKSIKPGNAIGKADELMTLTYGKDHLEASALHYQFLIKGLELADFNKLKALQVTNSITGRVHQINQLPTLPDSAETKSVHPWEFADLQHKSIEQIELSGEINILQDRVYSENQQVSILPGTTFKLAKGRSLVFYGKVTANGSSDQPIRFIQKDKGESWGSIIIQGASASSRSLQHIEVSG
ncbi:MAG: CotH kinase family protein, partial [Thiotrichaceae bacterium]|nr:CotH kinase family protein [Thiotrichaceae bacterium]